MRFERPGKRRTKFRRTSWVNLPIGIWGLVLGIPATRCSAELRAARPAARRRRATPLRSHSDSVFPSGAEPAPADSAAFRWRDRRANAPAALRAAVPDSAAAAPHRSQRNRRLLAELPPF